LGDQGARVAQDAADVLATGEESARIASVDQPIVIAGLRASAAGRKAGRGTRLRDPAA
jgi:hypothetical protein